MKGRKVLPPWGDTESRILIIGQSACTQCVEGGEPFYGYSGELLDNMLGILQIQKEDILITNCVLHNPKANRASAWDELENCKTFGEQVFSLQQPRIVITFGRDAHNFISRKPYSMQRCMESVLRSKSNLSSGYKTHRYIWIPEVHPSFYYRTRDGTVQRQFVQRVCKKVNSALAMIGE